MDALSDTLDRRVAQFKARLYRSEAAKKHGRAGSIRDMEATAQNPPLASPDDSDDEIPPGRVVRTKSFPLKPMEVDEAAVQMEMLGHTFFFFLNSATETPNVIYRRWDGNYGLIEPTEVPDSQ